MIEFFRKENRHGISKWRPSANELLPQSIEEYVAEDNPVRAYDAFVEALDFHELEITINPYKVGNAEYDPRSMLKLFAMAIRMA